LIEHWRTFAREVIPLQQWEIDMKNGGLVSDVLLVRSDGSKRIFRIYGRPLPKSGETIALPVDGRLIKARVPISPAQANTQQWADAAVVELVEEREMELV
jgi:hypothetical protein